MTELEQLTSVLPASVSGKVALVLAISPYVTRAYHALSSGKGLKGVFSSIWLGTNTPKKAEKKED